MPSQDSHLTDLYQGKTVDLEKLQASDWFNQGGANFHYGLPKRKNLWALKMTPEAKCCHTIWLFVFLYLDAKGTIKSIDTDVHQVFNNGSYESMGLPFFPHDYEAAKRELDSVIVEDDKDEAASVSRPIEMQDFVPVVGARVSSPRVKDVINKYSLRESLGNALFGAGRTYYSDAQRVELETDLRGVVKTVWLGPLAESDALIDGLKTGQTRTAIRKLFCPPTRSDKDGGWDRFDNDQYCLHLEYGKYKRLRRVTLMTPESAP